jgi:hypothetical protein
MKTGVGPRFDLSEVHRAAAEGRVVSGGPRYKERLLPLVGELLKMHELACAVLLELAPNDFIDPEQYPDGKQMDAYGLAISDALQERFGIEGFVTWYVKFTIDRDDDDQPVLMASLHGAEHPLKRVGGTIPVRFSRRNS